MPAVRRWSSSEGMGAHGVMMLVRHGLWCAQWLLAKLRGSWLRRLSWRMAATPQQRASVASRLSESFAVVIEVVELMMRLGSRAGSLP